MPASIHSTAEPLPVMFLVGSLSTGGAERFVANVVTHLDRARFKPYLAMYRDTISYDIPDDVTVRVLGKYKPWHNPRAVLRLARWIDAVQPAVLLSAWSVPNVFAAETLRWTRHKPVWIARIANNPAGREIGLYGHWARISYKRADRLVAVCRGLAEEFERSHAFARGRTQVLYNAIDTKALAARAAQPVSLMPERAVHLIAVGRLHPQKRFDVMLRAVAKARQQVDVHLHVLGEGELAQPLQQLAHHLGIASAVTWQGFCDDPYPYLGGANVFLLTSDYEGLSNSLLEAQALGLPAIATNCPFGTSEVVQDGKTGLLSRVGDVDQIAQHIVDLSTSQLLRQAMAHAARDRVRDHFSIAKMMDSLENILSGYAPPAATTEATASPGAKVNNYSVDDDADISHARRGWTSEAQSTK
ncbi:hypothetical protein CKO31_14215 [Thiohalocapsa halophila]|uniref:Glycosyltransferase subfamily 4-like N-terminal domain-containing protein n=1 Tax=Thiohalocapsa halophila TaxID=69359 RepID=A0ABS1CJ67_9GAMM|nr:glycosyltransferase [Thiohalocapsa halophila]MBK1631868.1 hypothetical protein [Thiohalocapsa halophila]